MGFRLVAALALLLLVLTGEALAQCPPGHVWRKGYCVPVAPPVVVAPPVLFKTVTSRTLYIRSCPRKQCPVITTVFRGQQLRVEGFENGFHFVRVPGTPIEGWAFARHLAP